MSKDILEYTRKEMEKRGFDLIEDRAPMNLDALVMIFGKSGNGGVVSIVISGIDSFTVGDNFHKMVDAKVENAVNTWDRHYDDRGLRESLRG